MNRYHGKIICLSLVLAIAACGKGKIKTPPREASVTTPLPGQGQGGLKGISLGLVNVERGKMKLTGDGLSNISSVKIEQDNKTYDMAILSQSDSLLEIGAFSAVKLTQGIANIIIGTATGEAIQPISVELSAESIDISALAGGDALNGQYLRWNSKNSRWEPTTLSLPNGGLSYKGKFDPSQGYPEKGENGYYYVASKEGETSDGVRWNVGDWAVYNSDFKRYDKFEAGSSNLQKLSDVDLSGPNAPEDKYVLSWDDSDKKWIASPVSDARIGALVSGKYCSSDGVTIHCDVDGTNVGGGSDLSTRMTAAESSITTLNTSVTNLGTTTSGLSTTVSTHSTSLSSLDTRVDAVESSATSLGTRMTSAESDISTISTAQTAQASDISSLDTRMDSAESNIATNTSDIADIGATLTDLGPVASVLVDDDFSAASAGILRKTGAGAYTVDTTTYAQTQGLAGVIYNLGLSASSNGTSLTLSLKQADGSVPGAGASAVRLAFRDAVGAYSESAITSALTLTIPQTATLGTTSGVAASLWVYLVKLTDNSIAMAISGSAHDDQDLRSVIDFADAVSGGTANSSTTMFSTTNDSNVAVRLIAKISITEATAGTWDQTPSEIVIAPRGNASNATDANVPDSIVKRDGSGNISANVTGNLTGTASSATNASNLFDGSTTISASDAISAIQMVDNSASAATNSTLVLRDSSGNFAANTITATLSGTATNATNVTTTAVATGTFYPLFVNSTTDGNHGAALSSGLSFNAATSTLTATTFSGALAGNASTATTATSATDATNAANVGTTSVTTDATYYPLFVSSTSGNQAAALNSSLNFNPSTGNLSTTTLTLTSDERKKHDILPLQNQLEQILNIDPVHFKWNHTNESDMGVIAQQVQTVYPEVVHTNADNTLSVSYTSLIGPIIAAIQELYHKWFDDHQEIAKLRQKNAELEERLKSIESRLDAMAQ